MGSITTASLIVYNSIKCHAFEIHPFRSYTLFVLLLQRSETQHHSEGMPFVFCLNISECLRNLPREVISATCRHCWNSAFSSRARENFNDIVYMFLMYMSQYRARIIQHVFKTMAQCFLCALHSESKHCNLSATRGYFIVVDKIFLQQQQFICNLLIFPISIRRDGNGNV